MSFRFRYLLPYLAFLLIAVPPRANAQLTAVTQHGEPLVIDASTTLVWADTPSPGDLFGGSSYPLSASTWAASLNTYANADGTIGYGGYTDWYLPTISQMVHLMVSGLGNVLVGPDTHFAPFTNLNFHDYVNWSNTLGPNSGEVYLWDNTHSMVSFGAIDRSTGDLADGAMAVRGTQSSGAQTCVGQTGVGQTGGKYSLIEIPPAGTYPTTPPIGLALNACGEVTGAIYPFGSNIQPHLFLYKNGVTEDLTDDNIAGCSTSGSGAIGYGINSNEVIAGTFCGSSEALGFFTWSGGFFINLSPGNLAPPPYSAVASAINANGLVTGTIQVLTGPTGCYENYYHPFLYDPNTPNTGVNDLNGAIQAIGGCSGNGLAINDSGQVVGYFTDSAGSEHAYVYSAGTATDLGNLGYQIAQAYGINAHGQVTGYSYRADTTPDAFLWSSGVMSDIGNLGGTGGSTGNAINVAGQVVGTSWITGNAQQHAFIYIAGTMVDLNSQISSAIAAKYTLVNAVAINDTGQIVVQGYVNSDTTKNTVTFLLTQRGPTITPLVTGTLGKNGWYVSATTLSWHVNGSPVPTKSGCGKVAVPNTTGTTYTCSATNASGNASNSVTIKRDTVAPAVAVKAPANDAIYAVGQRVLASYTCTDATSGVGSCAGTVAAVTAISTSVAGPQTFSVVATDNAGNTTAKSVSYTVEQPTATPIFSLKPGTYTGSQSVTISDATSGAVIYYTQDDTTPTTSSSVYPGTAINISSTETLKADAIAPSFARSAIRTAAYTIQ